MEFMKKFEAVILLSPDVSSSSRKKQDEVFTKLIENNSGKIINTEDWGLRDLSYKIENFSKAFYSYFQVEIDGDKIDNVKKTLSQDETFIRHLFVKVNEHQELPTKLLNEKK
tara:strand:+ start:16046 stop:16381 length:336 start_codon:yes stop_codon:yes gene_type:complete